MQLVPLNQCLSTTNLMLFGRMDSLTDYVSLIMHSPQRLTPLAL